MLEPRYQSLSISGYGKSVGTAGPIEAEIIVVKDFDELEQRSSEVRLQRTGHTKKTNLVFYRFQEKLSSMTTNTLVMDTVQCTGTQER